jgi:hypothetical protein
MKVLTPSGDYFPLSGRKTIITNAIIKKPQRWRVVSRWEQKNVMKL